MFHLVLASDDDGSRQQVIRVQFSGSSAQFAPIQPYNKDLHTPDRVRDLCHTEMTAIVIDSAVSIAYNYSCDSVVIQEMIDS